MHALCELIYELYRFVHDRITTCVDIISSFIGFAAAAAVVGIFKARSCSTCLPNCFLVSGDV